VAQAYARLQARLDADRLGPVTPPPTFEQATATLTEPPPAYTDVVVDRPVTVASSSRPVVAVNVQDADDKTVTTSAKHAKEDEEDGVSQIETQQQQLDEDDDIPLLPMR
jgi:hypothetical protein